MRGYLNTVKDDGRNSVHRLRVDLGIDAAGKRKQKMITVKCSKKDAQQKLRDLLTSVEGNTFVEPRKLTLGQWVKEWISTQEATGSLRVSTIRRYRDVIGNLCATDVAMTPLQKLTETHLERYYASVSAGSRHIHHTVIGRALRRAHKEHLLSSNPSRDMDNAPRRSRQRLSDDAKINCWSSADARAFLDIAKKAGAQTAAFFALALDTGARKNELCGLLWKDIDLKAGTVTIERQLLSPTIKDKAIQVGPTKTGQSRTTALNPETVKLLRKHQTAQKELKLRNGTSYHDYQLVFAKEWNQAYAHKDRLGEPLQSNNLGERMLDPLITKAKVKRITVHGLRHTAATLMLLAKIPVHVVAARLGHADVNTTLTVYAHVLKDAHHEAAAALGKLLHG